MMSLIAMASKVFQTAPTTLTSLILNGFGKSEHEGEALLESLISTGLSTVETFCMNDVSVWIKSVNCLNLLLQFL